MMDTTDVSYLAFNFLSTIAVTFVNKICFSKVQFGYPAALSNLHFLVTLVGVEALHRAKLFERQTLDLRDRNVVALVVVVGVVTPLNNTSLKLNSIGVYQIFKLLVTPCVVLLEYALDRRVLSKRRAAALAVVCLFVVISSGAALTFSARGTAYALLWVPLAALYKVQWGRVRRKCDCSTLALMRAVLPYAMCVQAALSPLVDPPGVLGFAWTREAVLWLGLSGACAFLVNFSGFLVMGNVGALAHVLLGQLKTAIIMVGAAVVFGSTYSPTQMLGAGGAVLAIVFYSHITIQEKERTSSWKQEESDLMLPLAQPSSNKD